MRNLMADSRYLLHQTAVHGVPLTVTGQ